MSINGGYGDWSLYFTPVCLCAVFVAAFFFRSSLKSRCGFKKSECTAKTWTRVCELSAVCKSKRQKQLDLFKTEHDEQEVQPNKVQAECDRKKAAAIREKTAARKELTAAIKEGTAALADYTGACRAKAAAALENQITPPSTAQFDSGGKGGTPMDEGPEELDPEYQELLRAQGKQKIAAALEKETKQGKKATVGKMASIVGNNAKVRCPPPLPLLSLPAPCLPTLTPLSV